jgi:hypothetical protein
MLTDEQLAKAKEFIFRHGRLLDRKYFLFHFESGPREAVLDVLRCYQNDDGGFGHGLEPDVMCPASTAICTEVAMAYLDGLGAVEGTIVDDMENWIAAAQQEDGSMSHPKRDLVTYPHGPWWEDDSGSGLALAGFLGKWGRGTPEFRARSEEAFTTQGLPDELGKYNYPLYMYLRHLPDAGSHSDALTRVREMIPAMLDKFAPHHPLFVFRHRWYSEELDRDLVEGKARAAVADFQEDGGLKIPYDMPWWRPIWTLQVLVSLKSCGLLE